MILDERDRCLKKVREAIGAHLHEVVFVCKHNKLRLRTWQLLNDTDNFIERTNRMLDRFEEDDKQVKEPKGVNRNCDDVNQIRDMDQTM